MMIQEQVMDKQKTEEALIQARYEELLTFAQPKSKAEQAQLDLAFKVAKDAHQSQRRKSGEPYIFHPIAVAQIVAEEIGLGSTSISSALLHDVVEDTEITLERLEQYFGKEIAHIVDGLTKITKQQKKQAQQEKLQQKSDAKAASNGQLNPKKLVEKKESWTVKQAENLKKTLMAMGEDIRIIIIKLADRLHNMRTMDAMKPSSQMRIASETLYLYAPVAHRLGLYRIKSELEDLSLKYTQRKIYKEIAQKLAAKKTAREEYIKLFIEPVQQELIKYGIPKESFKIFGRPKHIYSILNKIRNKKVTFENIYDLFAIRIILKAPEAEEKTLCWQTYSVIADLYTPKPDRLRDWISSPKSNGYESLHTTVMGPKGKWVEVQIRTERMDAVAEKGVAAHWKYKGGKAAGEFDDWLNKVREALKDRHDNAVEFINNFKHNFYDSEIFVFTPNGELRRLPRGASVLDFAFDIHTDIGCKCIGAKIDNKLCSISHKLKNGDQIEILTSKKHKPTKDWLNFAITSKARTKIKSYLKTEIRKVAEQGSEILERKLSRLKIKYSKNLVEALTAHFRAKDTLEFLYSIATKSFNLDQLKALNIVGDKIVPLPKAEQEAKKIEGGTLQINGSTQHEAPEISIFEGFADNVDYHIPNCCKPVAGDDVFGFISIHKGITIHRETCPNAHNLRAQYSYRIVPIKWTKKGKEPLYLAHLRIVGVDDVGIISRLTNVISNSLKINMRSISVSTKDTLFEGKIDVYVEDTRKMNQLIKSLKAVEGIKIVERIDE